MQICGNCKHWTQQRDRRVVNGEVTASAEGSCAIHHCLCIKYEDQEHCVGERSQWSQSDWEGPVERDIAVHYAVADTRPLLMPWQPGYAEWAKANPDLVAKPNAA
jgi:hypothetical protein